MLRKNLPLVAFFCLLIAASAAPLTQCPPRSVATTAYTGCNFLITLNPSGTFASSFDSTQPFFAGEDSYAGFQNNSSSPVGSIITNGQGVAIFALDHDGPGSSLSSTGFCPSSGTGPTGYEGPGVTFSNVSADCTVGQVNFGPSIAPGASAYFFLEEAISPPFLPQETLGSTGSVPECGTSILTVTSLGLLLWRRLRQPA